MTDISFFRKQFRIIRQRLLALPNSDISEFEGCTVHEILELEKYSGENLPVAYIAFLEMMGRNAGGLFQGSEASLSGNFQLRLREIAEKILASANASFCLPSLAFVFLVHQGYQFIFFNMAEGDDPPVYLVTHKTPEPNCLAPHFTKFLDNYVSDLERLAWDNPEAFGPVSTSDEEE